jgi:hypothetical protein
MKTTLNKIRLQSPCTSGWTKLLKHLGKVQADDVELDLLTVLESNGLDDALWCLRAVDGFDKEKRLMAVAFAREALHLMEDTMSIAALDIAERFAHGEATKVELSVAWATACSAVAYDYSTYNAASLLVLLRFTAWAAYAAANAAARAVYLTDSATYDAIRQNQVQILKKFLEKS